ncbi:hypothetical protein MVEN_00090000 [Mycena venus]|uniref:Uncharacterized protein n=1 Tax=Mycena venus TaxID=2733690 RepID=A0A8H6Z798_9AGAR|nr:hypothetical protein MVEN_00090000 [Mycena venus]
MSSITLHGVAALENPRVIPTKDGKKGKMTVLDGQLFLPSSEPALIGSFHFFNENNLDLPDVGCYSIGVRIARTTPTVEVYSKTLAPVDYHVIGDIFSLIPLGSTDKFDLRHLSSIAICGVPTNIDRDNATFDLNAEQYLHATRSSEAFPTQCIIPNSPKFKNYKPIPSKGKSVSVTGFLTGLERNEDKTVKYFIVDVDTVTFLGQPAGSTAPKAEESPTKISNGTPANLKFTGFFGNSSKSEEPVPKKRKTSDDRAAEEVQADDKEEGPSNGRPRRR